MTTESLQPFFVETDLITLAPPGFIHLELLKNITYLSAVAEDTYFRQTEVATKIRNNMIGTGAFDRQTRESALSTSKLLIDYMYKYYDDFFATAGQVVATEQADPKNIIGETNKFIDELFAGNTDLVTREKLISENTPGTRLRAQVVSVKPYGLFVEFGLDGNGFIHKTDFTDVPSELLECFEEGDWVEVEVIEFNKNHGRFNLRLLEILSSS